MTQVTIHIDSKKKLNAIKTILEAMDITYVAQELASDIKSLEQILLKKSESDITNGRVKKFRSHRRILSDNISDSGQ